MRIDGTKVAYVKNINTKNVRAFVCMDYKNEIAVLDTSIVKRSDFGVSLDVDGVQRRDVNAVHSDTLFDSLMLRVSEKGDSERVLDLMSTKQDIIVPSTMNSSALHCVVAKTPSGKCPMDALMILIEENVDINSVDSQNQTALHHAVRMDRFNLVLGLINLKADINCRDNIKDTALDLAMKFDDPDLKYVTLLRRMGSNDWTPLLHAAELGSSAVYKQLQGKQLLSCLYPSKTPFPFWFVEIVRRHPNLTCQNCEMKWLQCMQRSMEICEEGAKVWKINDMTDYSCALGGTFPHDHAIITWEIRVENVQSMWLGIAQIEEKDASMFLSCPIETLKGRGHVIAVSCDGEFVGIGEDELDYVSDSSFVSGNRIKFELNLLDQRLRIKINDRLALIITVSQIDVINYRPCVCMDYSESATIISSESYDVHHAVDKVMDEVKTELTLENKFWAGIDIATNTELDDIAREFICSKSPYLDLFMIKLFGFLCSFLI